jgi:hypothetical protein
VPGISEILTRLLTFLAYSHFHHFSTGQCPGPGLLDVHCWCVIMASHCSERTSLSHSFSWSQGRPRCLEGPQFDSTTLLLSYSIKWVGHYFRVTWFRTLSQHLLPPGLRPILDQYFSIPVLFVQKIGKRGLFFSARFDKKNSLELGEELTWVQPTKLFTLP